MRIQLEVIHKGNFKLDKWQSKFLAFVSAQNGKQPDWAAVVKHIDKNYKSLICEQNKTMAKAVFNFFN